MKKSVILGFGILVFSLALVSANVGLGISPSKMKEQVVAGETYSYEFLVFNTGSQDIDLTFSTKGDFADFVVIETPDRTIAPEPEPHEFPIKNGKTFKVSVTFPKSSKEKIYSGTFSAIGGDSEGSRFGGSVGVTSQVEFIATPPASIFSRLTSTHYIIIGALALIVLLIYLFKKMGIKIQVAKE